MPLVLGLDQAPSGTGWCYGDGSGPPTFGYRAFGNYADNESRMMDEIFDWLVAFGKSTGADAVCTEDIIRSRRPNEKTLGKQYCVMAAVAFACGKHGLMVPHYEAGVSEWRAWFLGTGKGDKEMAMMECARRDLYPENHHVAESIGIWSWCLQRLDKSYRARESFQTRRAQGRRDAERRERNAA